jgi:LysM repeat protein
MKKFFYRVNSGDTVLGIAERFNIPVTKIIKTNNLSCEVLEGDMLYLECEDCHLYKVQPTDTLQSIAQKFCTTEQGILDENGIEYIFYGILIKV